MGVRLFTRMRYCASSIALARAILRNPSILVLDEATSALDSEVEAAIQDQFQLLMRNKTVIAIAHRLSTIAMMDRLVVLDNGTDRVLESAEVRDYRPIMSFNAKGMWLHGFAAPQPAMPADGFRGEQLAMAR